MNAFFHRTLIFILYQDLWTFGILKSGTIFAAFEQAIVSCIVLSSQGCVPLKGNWSSPWLSLQFS